MAKPVTDVPFVLGRLTMGHGFWRANRGRGRLAASKECLEFTSLGTKHRFERGVVREIKEFHGPMFSHGIQIVHKLKGYPPFVVFTVFPPRALPVLIEGLKKYGYKVTETEKTAKKEA
jgi:hypothetical protein